MPPDTDERIDFHRQSAQRRRDSFTFALGETVARALADPEVVEIMANPDGGLWQARRTGGRSRIGTMDGHAAETVIRLMAAAMAETVSHEQPFVAGALPQSGERFQGILPPVVTGPTFTIRKHAPTVYPLARLVADGVITEGQRRQIATALQARRNVLIAGAAGSGKTTFANACLAEPCFVNDRVVILEDTRELRCSAPDCVPLLTRPAPNPITLRDLVQRTLRLAPDRIVIGEVRGGEALEMLKAWNTGHSGLGTIHANSCLDVLGRLEDLVRESASGVPRRTVVQAVGLIVFIERGPYNAVGRRVTQIAEPRLDTCGEFAVGPIAPE